jgi:hypothetical protein
MAAVDAEFLYCRYCLALIPVAPPLDGSVAHACPLPAGCHSCACLPSADAFSARQLALLAEGECARCRACVDANRAARYEPPPPPSPDALHEALADAVAEADVERVASLLAQRANPNFVRQRMARLPGSNKWQPAFSANGHPLREIDIENAQPTTPLKLVAFRISDCMLVDADLERFRRVAELLLQHGADPAPALAHCESRYGRFDPAAADSAFQRVVATIQRAAVAAELSAPHDVIA